MDALVINERKPSQKIRLPWLLLALALLSLLTYTAISTLQKREPLKIENNSGKNGQHANPDAQASAEQKYEQAKAALQKLKTKTNKTPEEKQAFQQLEKQMKHWQKKKGWSGENHSQKHKGN